MLPGRKWIILHQGCVHVRNTLITFRDCRNMVNRNDLTMKSRGLVTFLVEICSLNKNWHFKYYGGWDLNAYNFITAIITGRSLNWSLTLIYVFKLVLKNGFNLLFCCLPSEEAVVMSAWWGVDALATCLSVWTGLHLLTCAHTRSQSSSLLDDIEKLLLVLQAAC